MKGKTVKRKSKMPQEDDITDIRSTIIKEYSKVHLSVDVMHVNGTLIILQAHRTITDIMR
jgi:hypothetical protein